MVDTEKEECRTEQYFKPETTKDWKSFLEIYNDCIRTGESNNQWIFRGQRDYRWGLKTSLERSLNDFGIPQERASVYEDALSRRFKRHYHQYAIHVPDREDELEWFALMQHYGSPTRLLDWTYSIFVALYFAIESVSADGCCSIWAINSDWLGGQFERCFKDSNAIELWKDYHSDKERKPKNFRNLFMNAEYPISFIGAVNPYGLNERLVIQQGVFLCPGNVNKSFCKNLTALLSNSEDWKANCIKINVIGNMKKEFLEELRRMNMTRATLFPGLSGYAESFRTLLAAPWLTKL